MKWKRLLSGFRRRRTSIASPKASGSGAPSPDAAAEVRRLRIRSCLETILEANESLGVSALNSNLVTHFQRLERLVAEVEEVRISEEDIVRIEEATNRLLRDMRRLHMRSTADASAKHPPTN